MDGHSHGGWAAGIGLDFAIGRYAIAVGTSSRGGEPLVLAALDRRGALAAGWEPGIRADEVDVGRLASAHQWVVGTSTSAEGGSTYVISAYAADDEMRRLGEPLELASHGVGDVRVAGAKSRAVVVWTVRDGVMAQVLKGPTLVRDGPLFRVMSIPQRSGSSAFSVRFPRCFERAYSESAFRGAWSKTGNTPPAVMRCGALEPRLATGALDATSGVVDERMSVPCSTRTQSARRRRPGRCSDAAPIESRSFHNAAESNPVLSRIERQSVWRA